MSAKRRLLHAGAVAILLLGLAGCGYGTANTKPPDISNKDAPETEPEPYSPQKAAPESLVHNDPGEATDTEYLRVEAITPDFVRDILDKKEQNSDTVGWLHLPDTTIDQVVVKNPAEKSNQYYLNRSFERILDKNGTFCADRRAWFGSGGRQGLSRNTTIYGHSWDDDPDGELFAQLKKYKDPDFARSHPYIFFSTSEDDMVWEVVAVLDAPTCLLYNVPNLPENDFYETLDLVYDASLYSYAAAVGPDDKLLTLSTCTFAVEGHEQLPPINSYRFAIMARLVSPDEPLKAEAVFAINADPASPDEITDRIANGAMRTFSFGSDVA